MERSEFDHEVRNAVLGVGLEVRRIRMAMQRMETHLKRIDTVCTDCTVLEETKQELIDEF
jgi:hypothetical protein